MEERGENVGAARGTARSKLSSIAHHVEAVASEVQRHGTISGGDVRKAIAEADERKYHPEN